MSGKKTKCVGKKEVSAGKRQEVKKNPGVQLGLRVSQKLKKEWIKFGGKALRRVEGNNGQSA